eukprot:Em0012g223a
MEPGKTGTNLTDVTEGKLVECYVELEADTKKAVNYVKEELVKRLRLCREPLEAGKLFMTRSQLERERVTELLKKLFKQAYPEEDSTSGILLQRFVMGLKTPVSRQLLLRGKPDTFENAIEAAREIELVLEFESKPMELNTKISSVEVCDTGLQAALKDLTERLGNMEAQIQSVVQCSVAAGNSKTKAEARGTEQEMIILEKLHSESGHLGVQRTTEKVKERFYWPGYKMDIQNWVQECQQCQKCNPPQPHPLAPLGSIKCTYPFDVISWDIMGPLPLSTKGHKYGVPRSLHSDQGANLNSQVICALCKQLGINKTRTTAYHPQGNGQVERFNRTLEAILSKVVAENQRDWDFHIPKALFAYRTAFHESNGYSPFRVNFGRSPILPIDIAVGQLNVQEYGEGGEPTVPQYVETLNKSLRKIFI